MKEHKYGKYIIWGITAFLVIAACVLVALLLLKWDSVAAALRRLNSILAPITYGAILAYLLCPIYNRLREWAGKILTKVVRSDVKRNSFSRIIATTGSLLLLFIIVVGLFSMIIPTVWSSILGIVNSISSYIVVVSGWIETLFANNPEMEKAVMDLFSQGTAQITKLADLIPDSISKMGTISNAFTGVFTGVFTGLMGVFNALKNILIGIIVMMYLLNIKDTLVAQAKKLVYGLFPLEFANGLIEKGRFVHRVFGGFITGKLIDSLIIGILTFIVLSILKMPYTMLISVIIGVTNVIPFFGPFIGAIPSAFLLLLVSPKQCLIFLIVILLIQQFDGNVLGPKILGNSTGLSSFWVLFSILFFGGVMGPIGMIIGVPIFAVIYRLVTEVVEERLKKRNLSTDTEDYKDLKHIDEKRGTFIR